MTITLTKRYQTRSGQEVRIYAVDGSGEYPVHGAIHVGGGWCAHYWRKDGGNYIGLSVPLDLVPVPERIKSTAWLNIYPNNHVSAWPSQEDARRNAAPQAIAIAFPVEIDCEEGFGVKPNNQQGNER